MNILLIDDNEVDQEIVRRALSKALPDATLFVHSRGHGILERLRESQFDCVLLDYHLPGVSGLGILSSLASDPERAGPPVVMLTGVGDETVAVDAMKQGAADYIRKDDVSPAVLRRVIRTAMDSAAMQNQLREYQRKLERMAHIDSLTGIGNRAAFYARIEHLQDCSEREPRPFALLMIDLNKLKPINDRHGHQAGDAVLREAATRLTRVLRATDSAYRLGGDEFAALLETGVNGRQAELAAQRVVRALDEPVRYQNLDLPCSASLGLAYFGAHGERIEDLIAAADKAMYTAKREGRGFCIAPLDNGARGVA